MKKVSSYKGLSGKDLVAMVAADKSEVVTIDGDNIRVIPYAHSNTELVVSEYEDAEFVLLDHQYNEDADGRPLNKNVAVWVKK